MCKLAWDSNAAADRAEGKYVRERSDDPYHSWRWTRVSRAWRAQHPLCAECYRHGRFVPAEVTDHIVPWPVCGDFWDRTNYQSLCRACNVAKGNRDKKVISEWRAKRLNGREGEGGQNL